MITFKKIYELKEKERLVNNLRKLPENFLKDVCEYFNKKERILSKEQYKDIEEVNKQFENAKILFKELFCIRRKKIINKSLLMLNISILNKDYENMFEFEKLLFNDLIKSFKKSEDMQVKIINEKVYCV